MSLPIRATIVLLIATAAFTSIVVAAEDSSRIWPLVACATALPVIAAVNAGRKGARIGGREGRAWLALAFSMTLMVPIYAAELAGAYALENALIMAAYGMGTLAIILVPLPNAGPYQRMVAVLDALAIGVVVATATFWLAFGSGIGLSGHSLWAVSDAAIMAMVAYVVVRRSQRRGVDWSLLLLIGGVAAYLSGLLISSIDDGAYYLGHPADFAYVAGMMCFALAPLVPEQTVEPARDILRPVRWGHVLAPYALAGALAAALLTHQLGVWGDDPVGSAVILGAVATLWLVLARQLAMIAEQRRKIQIEQRGVIATISHELRTPLTAVVGFLDLLEDWEQFSNDEKIEMVAMMRDQSHVLARVVADLVDVAQQRIDHLDISQVNVDMVDFIGSAVAQVPELDRYTVSVDLQGAVDLTADRDRMLQIVTNLLSNAAKYGSSRVDIVAFEEGRDTVIEVHDDGPGVPDMFRLVIWERFERGAQRQSAIPGSGIGLSVARGIARSHGGDTDYRSSERLGGSCFSVRVPLLRGIPQRPTPPELTRSA